MYNILIYTLCTLLTTQLRNYSQTKASTTVDSVMGLSLRLEADGWFADMFGFEKEEKCLCPSSSCVDRCRCLFLVFYAHLPLELKFLLML